jgi:hypothetical protein
MAVLGPFFVHTCINIGPFVFTVKIPLHCREGDGWESIRGQRKGGEAENTPKKGGAGEGKEKEKKIAALCLSPYHATGSDSLE